MQRFICLSTDVSNKQSRRGYVDVGKVPLKLVIAVRETSNTASWCYVYSFIGFKFLFLHSFIFFKNFPAKDIPYPRISRRVWSTITMYTHSIGI